MERRICSGASCRRLALAKQLWGGRHCNEVVRRPVFYMNQFVLYSPCIMLPPVVVMPASPRETASTQFCQELANNIVHARLHPDRLARAFRGFLLQQSDRLQKTSRSSIRLVSKVCADLLAYQRRLQDCSPDPKHPTPPSPAPAFQLPDQPRASSRCGPSCSLPAMPPALALRPQC